MPDCIQFAPAPGQTIPASTLERSRSATTSIGLVIGLPSREDVANAPHCLNNLIDEPALAKVKAELSQQLDGWMQRQGDEGAATEAIAHTRKAGYRKPSGQAGK